MEKGDFNQHFKCKSPNCWSKYTTATLVLKEEQEEEGETIIKKEYSECKDEPMEDVVPTTEPNLNCEFCGKVFVKRRNLRVRGHS